MERRSEKRRRQNQPEVIHGRLTASFQQAYEAGCIQTGADTYKTLGEAVDQFFATYMVLMQMTGNNPCEGCPVKASACKCFRLYHTMPAEAKQTSADRITSATMPPGTKKYPGLSIAQIAEELGVSKSEVRRRKAAGEI